MKMYVKMCENPLNIRWYSVEKNNFDNGISNATMCVKLRKNLFHEIEWHFYLFIYFDFHGELKQQDQNAVSAEENKPNNEFEENFLKFERQKLTDIRRILMDFTLINLKESVKSVELLTAMYNDVASIDVDKDLEVNCNFFIMMCSSERHSTCNLVPGNRAENVQQRAKQPETN